MFGCGDLTQHGASPDDGMFLEVISVRFTAWSEMTIAVPDEDVLPQVLERLKASQCLVCSKAEQLRLGLCQKCRRKYLKRKKLVPKKVRKEWNDRQIRLGKVLGRYQVRQLTTINPFDEV